MRPSAISIRSVNQYRRRDVLAYLGLRYYLHSVATLTERWAQDVAVKLVLDRSNHPYLRAHHFKEINENGQIQHRDLHLPGPNEIIAESALLAECAKHPEVFCGSDRVFSYRLNRSADRSGVFEFYIKGMQARQEAVASACDRCPGGLVRYIDIKRFYPSIGADLASECWRRAAEQAGLSQEFSRLGEKLLTDHAYVGRDHGYSILTGPMFSHLIGGIVLREIDEGISSTHQSVYYCRYVDDIILVGTSQDVARCTDDLRSRLRDKGFELHNEDSGKMLDVSVSEWLTGRYDFTESRRRVSWMTLIGDLKRFLLHHPERTDEVRRAFNNAGFRIPILDYSRVVREKAYIERFRELAQRYGWFVRKVRRIDISGLLNEAQKLEEAYREGFLSLLEDFERISPFQRKRRISKLRYRSGRLTYLASDDGLAMLADAARHIPELHFHVQVMRSVATGVLDDVLDLGMNAAQAAGQALRASGKEATVSPHVTRSDLKESALAVVRLNGVSIRPEISPTNELARFASVGVDRELMTCGNAFIRELACLHGREGEARHSMILETAFDAEEDLALDAVHQHQYSE